MESNSKLCACGCGKKTARATRTRAKTGYVKGEYRKFVQGHGPCRKGDNSPLWKGGVEESSKRAKQRLQQNPSIAEEYRKRKREQCSIKLQELFLELVKKYGGECKYCKESRPEALLFHHMNGGGSKERRENGMSGRRLYSKLLAKKVDSKIVLICGTCHLILHRRTDRYKGTDASEREWREVPGIGKGIAQGVVEELTKENF